MTLHASVAFFDTQFQRQIAQNEFALNPFEQAALPLLRGRILDFGCGMGNLALHAARAGHEVRAYDASPAAIAHLQQVARDEGLPLHAAVADLRDMRLHDQFDGWRILAHEQHNFPAPGGTVKQFDTVIAQRIQTIP